MRKNCLEAIHAYANNKDDNSFVIAIPVAVWMRGPFMKSNRNKGGEGRRRGGGGGSHNADRIGTSSFGYTSGR